MCLQLWEKIKSYAVFKLKHTHIELLESYIGCFTSKWWIMYIYKYTHTHAQTQPREHHGNWTYSKQTTVTLLYIRYHTLHCTLRHEVLSMQNISRRFIDECNALRNEMHVYEISITPPRQIITLQTLLLLNYCVKTGHYYLLVRWSNKLGWTLKKRVQYS